MAVAKTTTTKQTKKPASKTEGGARRPARGGLAQTVTPDDALAAIVGKGKKTRAEITKAVWDYVREHDLQDRTDRRRINADGKLRVVFDGKDQVSMFEMTKLVNQHVS